MDRLQKVLSRTTAKPYRNKDLEANQTSFFVNDDGHLDFGPNDQSNPKNWSSARRWYITTVAIVLVINATFASSSPTGALEGENGISASLHVSIEAANLVTTLFLLGYVCGPLVWAPLSEFYGRRWIFYLTFIGYLIFNFLCAWAPNFAALLVGRFLCGTFVSAPLSNVPGLLADIWPPMQRGNAMALFSAMCYIGPSMGPIISGFLALDEDWRWSFYVLIWLGAAVMPFMLTIPETLAPVILLKKARRIRAMKIAGYEDVKAPVELTDRSLVSLYKVALTRPWRILVDPISLFCAIYLSVVYALLYMLFTIYPIVFQEMRGWNYGVGELPLIGTALGACVGGIIVFSYSLWDRKRLLAGHQSRPEDRLPPGMLGGILFAVSMFWFGWSGNFNSVPWPVPVIAGAFVGTSILLLFVAFLNYLTDTYLMYAASAIAANTVCRSAFGAAAPLFTTYMFDALGVGGGASLIGGVACLLAPVPFIFYKYGEPIRRRSKFAPTPNKNEKEKEEEVPPEQEERMEEEEIDGGRDEADFVESSDSDKRLDAGKEKEEYEDPNADDRSSIAESDKEVETGGGVIRAPLRAHTRRAKDVEGIRRSFSSQQSRVSSLREVTVQEPARRFALFPRKEDFF